ncbi:MAG: ChbG/HpnK family deacetylase [Candidatus Riflebacteria bacterium]|nr:ChbG/HpnK family deacetylase [Candidatus Riflebacteria bacterium]
MVRSLYTTADDFGMDSGIDDGIIKCVETGSVKNVSICFENPDSALDPKRFEVLKSVSIGLHFNLFPPDVDINRPKDWNYTRFLFFPNPEMIREKMDLLDSAFSKLAEKGLICHFINGHQHIHLFPGWVKPLSKWALRHQIGTMRKPSELGKNSLSRKIRRPALFVMEFLGFLGERISRKYDLEWIPAICRWGGNFPWENLLSDLSDVSENKIEVVLHPGFPTVDYMKKTFSPIDYPAQMKQLVDKNLIFKTQRAGFSLEAF